MCHHHIIGALALRWLQPCGTARLQPPVTATVAHDSRAPDSRGPVLSGGLAVVTLQLARSSNKGPPGLFWSGSKRVEQTAAHGSQYQIRIL